MQDRVLAALAACALLTPNAPAQADPLKLFTDFIKQPAGILTSWLFVKGEDFYHDPNGLPDLAALQANIEMQRALGFVKSLLDVKGLAALTYVKEAARRVK